MRLPVYADQQAASRFAAFAKAQAAGVGASDECVSVLINSQGQVCLSIPIIGNVCIPVSTPLPAGTAASACISLCTTWGIPTGACVSVSALGQQIARECFGKC